MLGLLRVARSTVGLLWSASGGVLVAGVVLLVVSGFAMGLRLLVAKNLIDAAVHGLGGQPLVSLLPLAVLLGITSLVVEFSSGVRPHIERLLEALTSRSTQMRIVEVAGSVPYRDFERPEFHDQLERAEKGASVRPVQMVHGLFSLVSGAVTAVSLLAVVAFVQPVLALITVLAYGPVWVSNFRSGRVYYEVSARMTQSDRLRAYLVRLMTDRSAVQEISCFDSSSYFRDRIARLWDERIGELRRTARDRLLRSGRAAAAAALVTTLGAAVVLWLLLTGHLAFAAAAVAAIAMWQLADTLHSISWSVGTLRESSLFLDDYIRFVSTAGQVRARPDGEHPDGPVRTISVEDVSFTYASAARPALRGVSIVLRQGTVVALVGENGAGKTTLVKLLCGLYAPQSGRIRWDGNTVQSDGHVRSEQVAVIFQDFTRYALSVRENIAVARPAGVHDPARIQHAAQLAGAHGFVTALPHGYETLLGREFEGGLDISLGQWQRIALARALYRDASVLILDEPTASLDPDAEETVFRTIRGYCADRIVLLISHRFTTVSMADYVYMMSEGTICEHGPHDELLQRGGRYAQMYERQRTRRRRLIRSSG